LPPSKGAITSRPPHWGASGGIAAVDRMVNYKSELDKLVVDYLKALDLNEDLVADVRKGLINSEPDAEEVSKHKLTQLYTYAKDGLFPVSISRLSGATEVFNTHQWTTIEELKKSVEERMQIPASEQVLLRGGRELKGTECLAVSRITFFNSHVEVLQVEVRATPEQEASMEVCVTSTEGIPDESIITVRAGNRARQAPLRHETPFKFPINKDAANPLKVDVFSQFGKARVVMNPMEDAYRAQVLSVDGTLVGAIEIIVKDATSRARRYKAQEEGALPPTEPPNTAASTARRSVTHDSTFKVQQAVLASRYMDEHGLHDFLKGLLHSVLREKPRDPYEYFLEKITSAARLRGKALEGCVVCRRQSETIMVMREVQTSPMTCQECVRKDKQVTPLLREIEELKGERTRLAAAVAAFQFDKNKALQDKGPPDDSDEDNGHQEAPFRGPSPEPLT